MSADDERARKYGSCLFVDGPAMEEGTGTNRISLELIDGHDINAILDAAAVDAEWDKDPFNPTERGSGMFLNNGSLQDGKESAGQPAGSVCFLVGLKKT